MEVHTEKAVSIEEQRDFFPKRECFSSSGWDISILLKEQEEGPDEDVFL